MKRLLVCLFALCAPSAAQIVPTVNLYTTYTDNLFLSASKRGDLINAAYIDLDYISSADLGLYYSGSANVFSDNTDLFSHLHALGLSFSHPLGSDGLLLAGGELGLRLDRPLYSYRDFAVGRAFASLKGYLRPELLARLSYNARYQHFLNAADYTYLEQRIAAQLTRYLPSHTTLQMSGEFGLKTYAQPAEAAPSANLSSRPGQDRNLLQWVGRTRVAQALGANSGLQLEWVLRRNLTRQSRFAAPVFYNPDDDLFDDRYSYQGGQIGTTLKYLGPWHSELVGRLQREHRDYDSRPAYDLDGFPTGRSASETRRSASLGISRTYYPENSRIQQVDIEVEWLYRTIDSNDAFYDASARSYSMGIQLGF